MRDQVSRPYKTNGKDYDFVCFNLYISGEDTGRQETLNRMAESIHQI
jgi:hypothetical protein